MNREKLYLHRWDCTEGVFVRAAGWKLRATCPSGESRIGPGCSFCFSSSLCSSLRTFTENSPLRSSRSSRLTFGCSSLTVVTTPPAANAQTAPSAGSTLAGTRGSLNWRMPKTHNVTQCQTSQGGAWGGAEAFGDARDWGHCLLRRAHQVKNHRTGEAEREATPAFCILTRICAAVSKQRTRADAQEDCSSGQHVGDRI